MQERSSPKINGYHSSENEIDRLSESIYSLGSQIHQLVVSQNYMLKSIDKLDSNVDKLNSKVEEVNKRNLKQDTILELIAKIWKISPYIVGAIFLITASFTDASFNLSKFIENKIINFINH